MKTVAVIFLATLALLGARRAKSGQGVASVNDLEANSTEEAGMTCTVNGNEGGKAAGMSVSWGIAKGCRVKCSPTSDADQPTAFVGFQTGFVVSFNKMCECHASGKQIVRFREKNQEQAQECAEGTSDKIHKECWDMYLRARGTRFENLGGTFAPRYTVPFDSRDFVVDSDGCGTPCKGEECPKMTLQGALEGMSREELKFLGQAIKAVMCGDEKALEKMSTPLLEAIKVLAVTDLDKAEFEAIDHDGDGERTKVELHDFYGCTDFTKNQLDRFIAVADANGDGVVDLDEFYVFKEEMRNFNPDVDLINGETEWVMGPDGVLIAVKAEWTPLCIKNGHPVDNSECEKTDPKQRTQEQIVAHMAKDC